MRLTILLIFLSVGLVNCATNDSQPTISSGPPEVDSTILSTEGLQLETIQLPQGFRIDVFARVNNARSMALSPSGIVYIGNRAANKVYAVEDSDDDGKANKVYTLLEGMRMPNGVAFRDGDLYVAEVSKLWKLSDVEDDLENPPTPVNIYQNYPTDRHHGWKYIAFGPDGKLYVPVGAPCNICESNNEIYASITRMDPDGSNQEIYVKGVRNSVGFTWHPQTGEMFFTENGRDWFGDDKPPCELNRVTTKGQHFGYPYCHGGLYLDDEFGNGKDCEDYVAPVQNLGPHTAPLGVKFCTSTGFPTSYENNIFIAEHGSWNRSAKIGYRISLVRELNGNSYETFASGWLNEATQEAWGRPVDLIFRPQGDMLLSDDLTGTIYRIWYEGS